MEDYFWRTDSIIRFPSLFSGSIISNNFQTDNLYKVKLVSVKIISYILCYRICFSYRSNAIYMIVKLIFIFFGVIQ